MSRRPRPPCRPACRDPLPRRRRSPRRSTRDFRPDRGRLVAQPGRCWRPAATASRSSAPPAKGRSSRSRTAPPRSRRCSPPACPPARLIVSVGALAIPDVARLAVHAIDAGRRRGAADAARRLSRRHHRGRDLPLLRHGDRARRRAPDLRLYLYHFPDISGVPITPQVVRRLDERYPGIIAGVKDSRRRRRLHRGADAPLLAPLDLHRQRDPSARPDRRGRARHDLRPRQRHAAADARDGRRAHRLRPPGAAAGAAAGRRHPVAPAVHPLGQGGHRRRASATPSGAG